MVMLLARLCGLIFNDLVYRVSGMFGEGAAIQPGVVCSRICLTIFSQAYVFK